VNHNRRFRSHVSCLSQNSVGKKNRMLTIDEYYKLPMKERFMKLSKNWEERAEEIHRKSIIGDQETQKIVGGNTLGIMEHVLH